jgi:hypothetical protein
MEVFKRFGATRDYQLYRIQFTLGESTRKRLFDEMKGYNDRLRNLLETNNAVSQAQNARDIARDARDGVLACGLWKRASGLYSVLSEAWKCSCWDRHHALLMLQDRHRLSPEPHFQLMLWSDGPHLSSSPDPKSGFYCSTRVEITDEPETHKNIPVRISPPPNKPALKRAIPLPSPGTPRKPVPASGKEQKQQKQLRVRFKGAQEYVRGSRNSLCSLFNLSQPSLTIASNRTPQITVALVENLGGLESKNRESAERGHQSGQQITCLCTTLREQHPPPRSCHGYILAANTRERFYVYSTGSATGVPYQTTKPTKPTPITLESIICGANPPLTRLQRLSLAVTVASSFIQLAGTPWLKPRWAKSDIVFLPDSPAMPHTPSLLDRPFVGRSFVNQHGPKQHDTDDGESKATISGSDEITDGFESLGIVLLELCFGKPIEMHPSWPQLPSGSGLLAALEWLKDVAEEAGPEYASAVAWCLIGGRTISTSRGDGWRRVMSNLVVKPLGQCRGHIAPVA